MRIGFVSDLHLERYNALHIEHLQRKILSVDVDVMVIGGDTYTAKTQYLAERFYQPIREKFRTFIIKGNHDYYGGVWEDDFIEAGEFVGGCLWTNFDGDVNVENLATKYITDFRAIEGFTADKCKQIYYDHGKKIFESDAPIVVTHFPPSKKAITEKFHGDPLNGYFVNDMDEHIKYSNKKLWLCGHTHGIFEFEVGNCKVISNPLGYPGELYKSLIDYKVLIEEIDL
jgi:Icc-related predicted phosphoesterase